MNFIIIERAELCATLRRQGCGELKPNKYLSSQWQEATRPGLLNSLDQCCSNDAVKDHLKNIFYL